jgi:hypothetical protein
MFTLARRPISYLTVALALGLGGCAADGTDEPEGSPPTQQAAEEVQPTATADPNQAARDQAGAPAQGDEEHLGKNSSAFGWGGGFYGPVGWGGLGWGGVGWGGLGWGGMGWGGLGWGGYAASTTVVSSTMATSVATPFVGGWGWGAGCMGCW